jgi:hypothetical protein
MLMAYVFWHWPTPGTAPDAYESAMRQFHRRLGAAGSPALVGSWTFRVEGEPWLQDARGYVDWYLLNRGSASLDVLNDLAVSPSLVGAHDRPAGMVADGAGGVYRLAAGANTMPSPSAATWLSKPAGIPYSTFDESLRPWTARDDVALWQRYMVLGPAPEFCLQSPAPLDLPDDLPALAVRWTALG